MNYFVENLLEKVRQGAVSSCFFSCHRDVPMATIRCSAVEMKLTDHEGDNNPTPTSTIFRSLVPIRLN